MREEITATVTLTFDCPAAPNLEAQKDMIADDIGRLSDADSTTGVACTSYRIDTVKSEAGAYSKPRTHMVCGTCSNLDHRADAYAAWDQDTGEWVLDSTYDQKYCNKCGETTVREVNEAEGLEIQAFAMINDGEDGARLVEDGETPDFYDLTVTTVPTEFGNILALHEMDDMTRDQAEKGLAIMADLYPFASLTRHYGEGVGS
jgi:hypothetical protein